MSLLCVWTLVSVAARLLRLRRDGMCRWGVGERIKKNPRGEECSNPFCREETNKHTLVFSPRHAYSFAFYSFIPEPMASQIY